MRIYLDDQKTGDRILQLCEQLGVEVLTPQDVKKRSRSPEAGFFLDDVDALVMEITHPTQNIHFILAHAILAQKPALCLYAKNQPPRELLKHLRKKNAARPIKTFSYLQDEMPRVVRQFISQFIYEGEDYQNTPSIKYTLRLTPRIDQYLSWLMRQHGVAKADVIRDVIENKMTLDIDFQAELDALREQEATDDESSTHNGDDQSAEGEQQLDASVDN